MAGRLQIRVSTYRGDSGFSLTGETPHGYSVKVFSLHRGRLEWIRGLYRNERLQRWELDAMMGAALFGAELRWEDGRGYAVVLEGLEIGIAARDGDGWSWRRADDARVGRVRTLGTAAYYILKEDGS